MANSNPVKAQVVLPLSANWQFVFVVVTLVAWLSLPIYSTITFLGDRYIGVATWTFQVSTWLLPIAFLAVALALLSEYGAGLKRIFMACLAATVGMAGYQVVSLWEGFIWNTYLRQPVDAHDTSWWTAFGNEWTVMVVCLLVFGFALAVVTRRWRR